MTILKSILLTLFFVIFFELTASWILLFDIEKENIFTTRLYNLINGIIELAFVLLLLKIVLRNQNVIPLKTNIRYYLASIIAGVSYPYIQTPLNKLYNLIFDTSYRITYDYGMEGLLTWNSIAVILLIPMAEELFFRGYILKQFLTKYKPIIAIGISTLLFALIHLPYQAVFLNSIEFNGHLAYIAFFGGLISGTIYYKSKSIGPSLVFHITWNLMVILI
ncbi:lysostaphin resistance A-like protein [Aquimarina macrocephali]|uniref:CPBP family intramembrane glutamic endopeptidase n=1 Tax=Aquimarina macrocephali TaxID=666563 RepID=UPI003F681D97